MSFAIDVRIIRLIAVAAATVVCPLFASSYCVEVTTLYQPSTQNARIHVFLQGKPHPDVKVAVFTPDGQLRLVVHTDSDAIAELPKLPAGKYCLNAMGDPDLGAQLCLDISKRVSRSPDSFSLDLGSEHGVSGWVSYNVLRAEEKAPTTKLQSFAGLVHDASGASIPRTVIFRSPPRIPRFRPSSKVYCGPGGALLGGAAAGRLHSRISGSGVSVTGCHF